MQPNKPRHVALPVVAVLAFCLTACKAEPAKTETAKPWELPTYSGEKPSHHANEKPDAPAALPNARELYERAISCWPAPSFLRAEVSVEGRMRNERTTFLDETGTVQGTGRMGVALVARLPLYSALELDKEREREYTRRVKVADAVGNFYSALTDQQRIKRELQLMRALERRAQERVRVGVTETAEQVKYMERVAGLEGEMLKLRGVLEKSRLELIGHCNGTEVNGLDSHLMKYMGGS